MLIMFSIGANAKQDVTLSKKGLVASLSLQSVRYDDSLCTM